MKASSKTNTVIQRYQAGERNFCNLNLRGANFRGQTLSGADFSGADIRGANFTDATLRGTNFTNAKAGLQKRWVLLQGIIVLLISVLLNFVGVLLSSAFLSYLFESEVVEVYGYFPGVLVLAGQTICFFAIALQGLTFRALSIILVTVAVVGSGASAGAGASTVTASSTVGVSTVAVVGAGAIAGAVAGAGAIAVAVAGAGAVSGVGAGTVAVVVSIVVSGVVAIAVTGSGVGLVTTTVAGAIAGAGAVCSLSLYVAWRVRQGDDQFAVALALGLALDSLGGTSFRGADLAGANFTAALLKNTSFAASRNQATILARTCFKEAKQLDRAQPGDTMLARFKLLPLLTGNDFINHDLTAANLRGANLDGAQLNGATLKRADLSEASLQRADLQNANLTEAQLVGTDLTGAYLTGACLEAWNIDQATLTDIRCEYYFLLEHPDARGSRDRRPHDPDRLYEPGEFEKILFKAKNIVEVLLKNCTNQQEFALAFQQLVQDNPAITYDSIQKLERKGEDILLSLSVPEDTDKGQVERSLLQAYDRIKQLEGKVEQLHGLRAADVKEISILALQRQLPAAPPINIIQNQGDNPVTEQTSASNQTDSSRNITIGNIGGDFTASGQALNLGDISGQVTNSINQLPDPTDSQPSLKTLLTQLQSAIETDPHLSPDDKAEALTQVQTLATAGQAPTQPDQKNLAKRALQMITGIAAGATATLTGTTGLLEAWKKLQPLLKTIFGL